jgi:hypothetical protein
MATVTHAHRFIHLKNFWLNAILTFRKYDVAEGKQSSFHLVLA